jgi:hypothetical protein
MSLFTTGAISSASPATSQSLVTRTLLLRGMLVGLMAGLLVFAFARWIGEPQVDRAIALENAVDQAKGVIIVTARFVIHFWIVGKPHLTLLSSNRTIVLT